MLYYVPICGPNLTEQCTMVIAWSSDIFDGLGTLIGIKFILISIKLNSEIYKLILRRLFNTGILNYLPG